MERITSFSVDHTKLTKGIYISRIDDNLITFDIRMTTPNLEPALDPKAAHTIEHIGATLLRNGKFKDKIIGYKTYYFNMIFSQNTKIILQNHIQIRFYIRKQEKLGYKKSPP